MGLKTETINLINSLYRNVKTFYKCSDLITPTVPINRGVLQGCPISMIIFCLTIDFLLHTFMDRQSNLTIKQRNPGFVNPRSVK